MPRLIVLEGLDGSGKATQAKLLTQALQERGFAIKQVSFPNYSSPFSIPAQEYLAGKLGNRPEDVNPYAASLLYGIDRFASFQQEWKAFYQQGGIIVADRYTTSNAVHQCSKLKPQQWQEFTQWLFDLEYQKVGIPAPDLVFYLSVDLAVSQTLLNQRSQQNATPKDIHENNLQHLLASKQAAEWCAKTFGWHTIQCSSTTAMRPIQEISDAILQQVLLLLQKEE